MQKTLALKAIIVLFLGLALIIPLAMIKGLVSERQLRQHEAAAEVAASYAGQQLIVGPLLVVPYVEEYPVFEADVKTGERRQLWKQERRELVFFPDALDIVGTLGTSRKRRGLFSVLLFDLQGTLGGRFTLPAEPAFIKRDPNSRIAPEAAFLSLHVSDPRGIAGVPELEWNGQRPSFAQGSRRSALDAGIHAPLGVLDGGKAQEFTFAVKLTLGGTEQIGIVPVAQDNRIEIRSDWPHPSFGGRFLPNPRTQTSGAEGFTAQWRIAALATRAQKQVRDLDVGACKDASCLEALQVRLVEPINVYSQSDRATKYAMMFIVLTFGAFFLFEILKRLPVHPAQYALVGLALAMFFLLLLSLSEHVRFGLAYAVAVASCVALVTGYLKYVLAGLGRALAFGALLGSLYGALYGLLISEDNALLLGSALLFALLAAAMWLTRHVDWYRLSSRSSNSTTPL